jgi:hypothetical protein
MENRGTWARNCSAKSEYIARLMDEYPERPIVWIDSDGRVRQYPELFDELDCDFAFHRKGGVELLSGTLYIGPTDEARAFIGEWVKECKANPERFDQRSLDIVVQRSTGVRFELLPATYCQIFDSMRHVGTPVIEHMQASRRLRQVING